MTLGRDSAIPRLSVKSAIVSPGAIGLQGFPCCLGIMEQTESVSCGWVLKPIDGKS